MGPPGLQIPLEDQFINERDGDEHLRIRRVTHRALMVAGALQVGPFVRGLSERLITTAVEKRESDLMLDLCREIPPRVVTHLMNLSDENHVKFVKWVNEVQYGDFFTTRIWREQSSGLEAAYPEFAAYLDHEIEKRRDSSAPPSDFIAGLLFAADSSN